MPPNTRKRRATNNVSYTDQDLDTLSEDTMAAAMSLEAPEQSGKMKEDTDAEYQEAGHENDLEPEPKTKPKRSRAKRSTGTKASARNLGFDVSPMTIILNEGRDAEQNKLEQLFQETLQEQAKEIKKKADEARKAECEKLKTEIKEQSKMIKEMSTNIELLYDKNERLEKSKSELFGKLTAQYAGVGTKDISLWQADWEDLKYAFNNWAFSRGMHYVPDPIPRSMVNINSKNYGVLAEDPFALCDMIIGKNLIKMMNFDDAEGPLLRQILAMHRKLNLKQNDGLWEIPQSQVARFDFREFLQYRSHVLRFLQAAELPEMAQDRLKCCLNAGDRACREISAVLQHPLDEKDRRELFDLFEKAFDLCLKLFREPTCLMYLVWRQKADQVRYDRMYMKVINRDDGTPITEDDTIAALCFPGLMYLDNADRSVKTLSIPPVKLVSHLRLAYKAAKDHNDRLALQDYQARQDSFSSEHDVTQDHRFLQDMKNYADASTAVKPVHTSKGLQPAHDADSPKRKADVVNLDNEGGSGALDNQTNIKQEDGILGSSPPNNSDAEASSRLGDNRAGNGSNKRPRGGKNK